MKHTRFLLAILLFLATPLLGGVIDKIDLSTVDDTGIEIAAPVWDGSAAGSVLVNRFDSKFDREVAKKLASGFRNAMISSQTLAESVDLGEILAASIRAEGRKLGLTMMEPQEGAAPQWVVGGTIRQVLVEIQHVYAGSLLLYGYLDVDVTIARQGEPATTTRMHPARLFVMFNGGMGTGDEAQHALVKTILVGSHHILARLNREHFHAPALSSVIAKLNGLKDLTEEDADLHLIGLSGSPEVSAALAARLPKEKDEGARTDVVHALTNLGAAPHAALLISRYASEDPDVRYATLVALDSVGTDEAFAVIRDQGTKDKSVAIKKLAERLVNSRQTEAR